MTKLRRLSWLATAFLVCLPAVAADDWRLLENGLEIPDENYADQPYVVVTDDGHWLCTLTTGAGNEGKRGQHVVAAISEDQGRTWSDIIPIEPDDGPEASWVVPLKTDFGRVYAFYTYNGDNVDVGRNDTHGWYAAKYSDDGGYTWSDERLRLPMRITACDTDNGLPEGTIHFWGICKPIVVDGVVYFTFTKLSKHFLQDGEGWLFRSDNILTERDPSKIHWEMLPDGDHGIRHPEYGSVQEEHNLVALTDTDLYCVYRTTLGFPAVSYSHDAGHTWTRPEPMRYAPEGRFIRTPRACPRVWQCANGNYLFWFHNHDGHDFNGRNPVWISGGVAKEGTIIWSEPEILLYTPDVATRMSYPDLIEQDGRYWVTETQKEIARVHEIPADFLDMLWKQGEADEVARQGCVAEFDASQLAEAEEVNIPALPSLTDGGFTIDFWFDGSVTVHPLLEGIDAATGKGFAVRLKADQTVELTINDGQNTATWASDEEELDDGVPFHMVFIVDGGSKIISIVVDGELCDGRAKRQYGWGRFPAELGEVHGGGKVTVAPFIRHLRVYDRALYTSEAVGNFRAGF